VFSGRRNSVEAGVNFHVVCGSLGTVFRSRSISRKESGRKMEDYIRCHGNLATTDWVPAADIYENEKCVMIFVDIAGVNPDQVRISLENRSILITGERITPSPGGVVRIHQMEIDAGLFRRRITLPCPVDFDNSECTYKSGFLRIDLPKRPKREAIRIPVESE
jgi:HSP20 family protein